MKSKERNSNIELLRIISIILIISFHLVYKSNYAYIGLSYNTIIVKTIYFFGELGVNIFSLITGYYMIKSNFKSKKLILILLEVLFYYLITTIIGIKIGILSTPSTLKEIILLFFPTILSRYWYVTVYIITYILSPYLNIFLKAMKKEEYKSFLKISLLLWCIIPTIFGIFFNSTETLLSYSRLIWLIIIYCVGAYIRLYGFKRLDTIKKKVKCSLLCFTIMFLSIFVIHEYRFVLKPLGLTEIAYFWTPNNIFMFLLSISIFGIFLDLKCKTNKCINTISTTTLGIYLIHDSNLCIYIWKEILNVKKYLKGTYPIEYIVIFTISIFIIGVIIDIIRQFIENKTIVKIIDYVQNKQVKCKYEKKVD